MTEIIYTDDARSTIYPSSQVDSTLPNYITENFTRFVDFMERSNEAQERLGFGQNLLQNLQKYRDVDTYQDGVIEFGVLAADVAIDEETEIELESTYGFPSLNGVILIDEEVINYREVVGNKLVGLQRACATTTVLPTFLTPGTYTDNPAGSHLKGSSVKNISVLFLSAMGQSISDSFSDNVSFRRINSEIDKSILLENLVDFYQSKGSKLGIKTLFKMFFAENDVDVNYPGDRMIEPSSSTYVERQVLRSVPVPEIFCDPYVNNVPPERILGSELVLKSYLEPKVEYAKTFVNYVATYPYKSEVQYTIYVDDDFLTGNFISNPQTTLTRNLNNLGTTPTDLRDIFTVTVESTLGFPDKGIIFVDNEAIEYDGKSENQFFNCKRGAIGIFTTHLKGAQVYGPYYIEGKYTKDGETYVSRSWPLGLVTSVDIKKEGLLHTKFDEVYVDGPGRIDPRDKILSSFVENYNDELATQTSAPPNTGYIGNFTAGVSGVYFDDKNVFVTSSNLPYDAVGPFSTNETVGPDLEGDNAIHVIPRRNEIKPNPFKDKGTKAIGVFADGVTAISNVMSLRVYKGIVTEVVVLDKGAGYITPTLAIDDTEVTDTTFQLGSEGEIVSVTTTSQQVWEGDKSETCRVSSGEGAVIDLTFDAFGRVSTATISNAGKWFYDLPGIQIIDTSGRGRGAVLTVTNDSTTGTISSVTIINNGIDYNPATTYAQVLPRGSNSKIDAVVQFYEFNKPTLIERHPNTFLDQNNGYCYENEDGVMSQYGYVMSPAKLKERLNDDGSIHSPILGWAYDGNPIYGPNVWKNKKNASGGITTANSGYYLRVDRTGEIAGGGKVAVSPPSEDEYPMGSFVQDYAYDPARAAANNLIATSNLTSPPAAAPPNNALLETDPGLDNIIAFDDQIGENIFLSSLNGMVANTPEYPEELYPDGIFFYVATTSGVRGQFPYIIGSNFYNRPISQNVRAIDTLSPNQVVEHSSYTPGVSYEKTVIDFDFNKLARYRNPYLESTKDNLSVEIDTVSVGTISGISVINGAPDNSEVGDYIYFDNTGTGGGDAQGKVTMVEGVPVENGYGQNLGTTLISHRQLIDLDYFWRNPDTNQLYKPQYVFVPTTQIETTSGAIATVESYDYTTRELIVHTTSIQLIQPGDVFFDNAHKIVVARPRQLLEYIGPVVVSDAAPSSPVSGQFAINTEEAVAVNSWTGIEGQTIKKNQFLYYTTQWNVVDNLTAFDGDDKDLSDYESAIQGFRAYFMFEGGEQAVTEGESYMIETEEGKRIIQTRRGTGENITISFDEPKDAQQGDLWWSINNGRLFVYYEYYSVDSNNKTVQRAQWVSSQPFGTQTLLGASDSPVVDTPSNITNTVFHQLTDNSVFISDVSPTSRPDGSQLILGDLWWSSTTGLLYIWITNTTFIFNSDELLQSEWVVTDPSAIAPMTGASDSTNPTNDPGTQAALRASSPFEYTFQPSVTVFVSTTAPTEQQDGTALEEGNLWWSPLSGRTYIYYNDGDTAQWTVTNPIGSMPTAYAADTLIDGGKTLGESFVRTLPELPTQDLLFFTGLKNFQPGDKLIFESSPPGTTRNTATLAEIIPGGGARVGRDANSSFIPDGTPTFCTNRFLFNINCVEPTGLQKGDLVKFIPVNLVPKIDLTEVSATHFIQDVGSATAPIAEAVIGEDPNVPSEYGEVLGVRFSSLGAGYTEAMYIYFYGGGGTGALGYAEVDENGSIVLVPSSDPRFPNGNITMINPGRGYTQTNAAGNPVLPTVFFGTELTSSQFQIYTSSLQPVITGFVYCTSKQGQQGRICEAEVTSSGLDYATMPKILGTYKKFLDQAVVDIFLSGSTIDDELVGEINGVEVLAGGSRYQNPTAVFYDLTYPGGSGATANVTVVDGEITKVTMVTPGQGYVQPRVHFVEETGKFIPLTDDIGRIKSLKVLNPGRNISPDRTLKPELLIDTRCIVEYQATSASNFIVGEAVYQGIITDKLFTATVKAYDNDNQIVTLSFVPTPGRTYGGVLKVNEDLIGEQSGAVANVVKEGQADTPVEITAVSSPAGFFLDDQSMLSRKYAVVQDSYYFSPFSYEISSPMQKSDYETIVRNTTHPVGFALFSNVKINEYQQSGSFVMDANPVRINT